MMLVVAERTFRPIVTLRVFQLLRQSRFGALLSLVVAVLHRVVCNSAAIDLPVKTQIGPGLDISHGWGLVVSGRAILGSNVTLFHGATIGQGDKIAPDGSRKVGYPVIEDDVWIGPHATVVGGIVVGAGSRIMPGAVVWFDVPPRSMVAGNPGTIVQNNCAMDVRNRAPLDRKTPTEQPGCPARL